MPLIFKSEQQREALKKDSVTTAFGRLFRRSAAQAVSSSRLIEVEFWTSERTKMSVDIQIRRCGEVDHIFLGSETALRWIYPTKIGSQQY
jgi:hypothetical protein